VVRKVRSSQLIWFYLSHTHPFALSSRRSRSCRLLSRKGKRFSLLWCPPAIRLTDTLTSQTVLLDDPLSAVDSHTARHLFRKCLKGPLLANRTVVSVSTGSVSNSSPDCHHVVVPHRSSSPITSPCVCPEPSTLSVYPKVESRNKVESPIWISPSSKWNWSKKTK